jgi:hypothetical protein
MKLGLVFIAMFSLLILPAAFAQDVSVDQLKQMMTQSTENLTTYTYSRSQETEINYSNNSLNEKFDAVKATQGKVNLTAQAGMWSHRLTDNGTGEVLTWEGYFVNGSEYWKEGQNWTKFNITDAAVVMADYNELPSEIGLLNYSQLEIVGTESYGGEDCYKLVGTPIPMIVQTILGVQLFASYLSSPFPLPDDFNDESFDFANTDLLNNSNVTVTAWISKETSLLRRIDIDSGLTITPAILNITEPDFRIETKLNETTSYSNFGEPVQIVLPAESQNQSTRMKGADWRWAIFGLVEP